MKDNIKILAFTNLTASHVWRFDPVARWLNKETMHEMAVTTADQYNGGTLGADLVIMEMLSGHHIVDTAHNMGAKVIYEADDAVLDTYGRERKNLMHIDTKFRSSAIETIRKCDALTVATPELAENYARYTDKPIYVLPIYMDYDYYNPAILTDLPKRNTDEIRLGWFGSKGHFEDLKMVIPDIIKVLKKDKRVKFIYCGYGGMESDNEAMKVLWGEDVFKEIPRDRREFVPGVPEEYWPMKHRFMDLDIGLAPLIDDKFNAHKCPTKWFEYSVLKTPAVCSPTVYNKVVTPGKTGLIATDNWYEQIMALVNDKDLRTKIGEAASQEVFEKHDVTDHLQEWLDVYQKVVG